MLVTVNAHQTPSIPRGVADSAAATGSLADVKIMLRMEDGSVFPNPENAPTVVISMHMNIWEYPRIFR